MSERHVTALDEAVMEYGTACLNDHLKRTPESDRARQAAFRHYQTERRRLMEAVERETKKLAGIEAECDICRRPISARAMECTDCEREHTSAYSRAGDDCMDATCEGRVYYRSGQYPLCDLCMRTAEAAGEQSRAEKRWPDPEGFTIGGA